MRSKPLLFAVEDDPALLAVMCALLEVAGFSVHGTGSAAGLHALLAREAPDLILLDLGLPDEDGLVLARQMRARSQVPIIMVTGRGSATDRITGLEIGANDYVVKPFEPRELILRIWNILNLASGGQWSHSAPGDAGQHDIAGLTLDCDARRLVDPQGREIPLTFLEFELLRILVSRGGRVQTRESLLDGLARSAEGCSDRAVDVLVSRLRRKLRHHGAPADIIHTVSGVGYRLGNPLLS
ncbi:MAG: response regulator transcription factor [Magnetococcus sp. WYHC-3]